jgi:hypothetical protein
MPKRKLPRVISVAATGRPFMLGVAFDTGATYDIDLSSHIHAYALYRPLRRAPKRFARVIVGEDGTDIVWSETIDMSADTLWRLAREQAGITMSAKDFRAWRDRNRLTLDAAASELGVSRRMLAYYEEGKRPVPRVVALATQAVRRG